MRLNAGEDGKFKFDIPAAEFATIVERGPWASLLLVATAQGLGPDWVSLRDAPKGELTLRLADDSIPITGRIVDLQGKAVAGAKITRGAICAEGDAGLDAYLTLVREDPFRASNHNPAKTFAGGFELAGLPESVMTDADGRFRISGIGRERIVDLEVEGATIQSATVRVMTRSCAKVSSAPGAFGGQTIYPATFEHFIPPGRALTGIVRDRDTQRPLAGVMVGGAGTNAHTRTDEQGRYTLAGFPKSKSYGLMVLAGHKPPYFVTCMSVSDAAGLAPIEANVDCRAGILLRLKLTDKETGKPVRNADVMYQPVFPNPHARDVPGYAPVRGSGPYNSGVLQDDGSYLIGVLPGPGAVFIRTAQRHYRPACVDPQKFFKAKASDSKEPGAPLRRRQLDFHVGG